MTHFPLKCVFPLVHNDNWIHERIMCSHCSQFVPVFASINSYVSGSIDLILSSSVPLRLSSRNSKTSVQYDLRSDEAIGPRSIRKNGLELPKKSMIGYNGHDEETLQETWTTSCTSLLQTSITTFTYGKLTVEKAYSQLKQEVQFPYVLNNLSPNLLTIGLPYPRYNQT